MGSSEADCRNWTVVEELDCEFGSDEFWDSVSIWINRPHILNKRISAVTICEEKTFKCSKEYFSWQNVAEEVISPLSPSYEASLLKIGFDVCHLKNDADLVVEVRSHLPKLQKNTFLAAVTEILIKDLRNNVAVFIPKCEFKSKINIIPQQIYALEFVENTKSRMRLLIYDLKKDDASGVDWVKTKLLTKLFQWANESTNKSRQSAFKFPSLKLISTENYVLMYQKLKIKYGPKLVEIWPEKTDPSKFVYEDIALASYILIIWELQRKEKNNSRLQSFVDLGCGNGLLTHILISEGHEGLGIDIKKRKIWDYYGQTTNLKECTYIPSPTNLFPDFDWIIGNHSDELTPWIPVIAARSSPSTCFFLLPCCAYNFDSKFQRRNSKLSQYEDYIEFVRETVRVCGFKDEIDKLRIPSTKRICLVGRERLYQPDKWGEVDAKICELVRNNCVKVCENESRENKWGDNFQPRPSIQLPRNCTTLEQGLKDTIVKTVAEELLRNSTEKCTITSDDGTIKSWNFGGSLHLSELAKIVKSEDLHRLKSEFGGLQTLLRNHSHIFHIVQGMVQLKNYLTMPHSTKKQKLKIIPNTKLRTKPCWFHFNHPDGCLVEASKCHFMHRSG